MSGGHFLVRGRIHELMDAPAKGVDISSSPKGLFAPPFRIAFFVGWARDSLLFDHRIPHPLSHGILGFLFTFTAFEVWILPNFQKRFFGFP